MLKRKLFGPVWEHLPQKEHTIVVGPRQAGKSTLLRQLRDALAAMGRPVALLNLERSDVRQALDERPENLFSFCPLPAEGTVTVFVDEIQYLRDPSNFLKLLYDEYAGRLKIVATGSSAFYIDRGFKDSLAGRKRIFELYTLDFEEFLLFSGLDELSSQLADLRSGRIQRSGQEAMLTAALGQYAVYGGYPAVVLEQRLSDKEERLYELRDAFVKRDILESGVADEQRFYRLMALLAGQTGSLLNVHELAKVLRMNADTVERHLYVLQKCFHLALLRPFFANLTKELVKMPKAYFQDIGLRNALLNNFSPFPVRSDKGALLESLGFLHLHRLYGPDRLHYWRTADGHEVDFVVQEQFGQGFAWEMKSDPSAEISSKYQKFVRTYPNFPLRMVGPTEWLLG
jgi:predicted AAA+ superfamily ATPase